MTGPLCFATNPEEVVLKRIAILGIIAVCIGCFSMEVKSEIGADGKGTQTMILYGLRTTSHFSVAWLTPWPRK